MLSSGELQRVLSPVSDALAADGYRLDSSLAGDTLSLRIFATAGACKDCLVPKGMMIGVVRSALRDGGVAVNGIAIELIYPNDA